MRKYRVNADSWTELWDILVASPEEFNPDSATIRGRMYGGSAQGYTEGALPDEYASEMRDSIVRYVIFSYDTPIAYRRVADWNANGTANYEWVMPDVKYSVTTSKHQGKARTALSQISESVLS